MASAGQLSKFRFDSIGLSFSEAQKMNPGELKNLLEHKLEKLSTKERKKLIDQFNQEKSVFTEKGDKLTDQLRDLYFKSKNLDKTLKQECKGMMDGLDELMSGLDDISASFSKANTSVTDHHISSKNGAPVDVEGLVLDENDYTYDLGGKPNFNPLAKELTENEYLFKKGLTDINGNLLTQDSDGKIQEKIEQALVDRKAELLASKQQVTIKPNDGEQWRLSSFDPISKSFTFTVEDSEGNFTHVTFNNTQDAIFKFEGGLSTAELQHIQDVCPQFLFQAYASGETQSFGEQMGLTPGAAPVKKNPTDKSPQAGKRPKDGKTGNLGDLIKDKNIKDKIKDRIINPKINPGDKIDPRIQTNKSDALSNPGVAQANKKKNDPDIAKFTGKKISDQDKIRSLIADKVKADMIKKETTATSETVKSMAKSKSKAKQSARF